MKLNLLLVFSAVVSTLIVQAGDDCVSCTPDLSAYRPGSKQFIQLAMLQKHVSTESPTFFTCKSSKYKSLLKKDENWHLRDKDCKELDRIFANREVHKKKEIYTKRLRGVYCGNSIRRGDPDSLKKSAKRFKADGDVAFYMRRRDFRKCESNHGNSPLYDLGQLSPRDAERVLEYLVFEEKIDLNGVDGNGLTIMDWTQDILKRHRPGTLGYKLVQSIRKIIRDPRLGERKAKFSCEIMGTCSCVDTFGHENNKNCPPTYQMLSKLGSRKHL